MNHQSRNKYYSDERGRDYERGNRDQHREDRPSWDYEDEDEDFQGGRSRQYRSNGPRERERSFSERSGGARGQRDQDEPRGSRQDYSRRQQGDWDIDQPRGGARSTGSRASRDAGRDYESSYGDFEERTRQPSYSSSGQGYSDWRDNPQRGGRSGQSRYSASSSGYGQRERGAQRGSQQYSNSPAGANYWYAEYWLIPGPHSGTGPKGYQRSSESLKEQVCERLEGHGEIDASEIEVAIQNGEVTLTGKVENREQKRMAEDCAGSVRGVKDVHNQLKVEAKKQSKSDDNQMDESGTKSADKKGKQPSNPAF
jgi:osmotically-inducible protein OsmY